MQAVLTDFTDDGKPYVQLVFPAGVDLLDGELNLLQRNQRVPGYYRQMLHGDASGAESLQPPVPHMANLRLVSDGADGVQLELVSSAMPGIISVRGQTWIVTGTVHADGVVPAGPLVGDHVHEVYIELKEQLITEIDDPNIEVQDVGPTAGRLAIVWSLNVGAADATPSTSSNPGDVWTPNTPTFKRAVVALIRRKNGENLPLPQYRIVPRWAPVDDWLALQHRTSYFAASDRLQRSSMRWQRDGGGDFLRVTNVALYLPNAWDTTNTDPIRWTLPASIEIPNDGDSLYVILPAAPRSWGDNPGTSAVALLPADLLVLNAADVVSQMPASAVTSFPGLLKRIATRVGNHLALYDGRLLPPQSTPDMEGDFEWPVGSCGVIETPPHNTNALSESTDLTPYIRGRIAPQNTKYKLVDEFLMRPGPPAIRKRQYISRNTLSSGRDSWVTTINAWWNTTFNVWVADDASLPSCAEYLDTYVGVVELDAVKRIVARPKAAPSTWADNAWVDGGTGYIKMYASGRIEGAPGGTASIENYARLYLTGNGDPAVGVDPNVDGRLPLYNLNIPKAWGRVTSDGIGGIFLSGRRYNVKAATIDGVTALIELHSGFADTSFCPVASMYIVGATVKFSHLCYPSIDGTHFRLAVFDTNSGAALSWATNLLGANFVVFGDEAP